MAERLRQNTVKIEAGQRGFGFIVGEKGGFLYIATARHILIANDNPDSPPVTKARVVFYSDQGKSYTADVLGTHTGDLAVLRVSSPPNFRWIAECLAAADKQNRGTHVWFVGRRDEWYVPAQTGTIASDRPSTQSLIEIDGLSVSPGTSGAPLIADTGIVGMIQNDLADDARALTVDYIQRAFQDWNYPWDLRAATVSESCLNGTWKEQYENPLSWSFSVNGSSLTIRRDDNFVSGVFTKSGSVYKGELHWGNGDVWRNVVLTPNEDCSQVRTNKSWWYRR
jgi:hypothetical protein